LMPSLPPRRDTLTPLRVELGGELCRKGAEQCFGVVRNARSRSLNEGCVSSEPVRRLSADSRVPRAS
jgi:hypothetical protein